MMQADGLTAPRPIAVPLWLSAFGPRGAKLARSLADGIIGVPQPGLPAATLVSGTVLEPGEDPRSVRAREAVGPWRVVPWHEAYATAGADAVDARPGGQAWREALEALSGTDDRHLLTFEGHITHLPNRDRQLLEHIDTHTMVAEADAINRRLDRLATAGFHEVIYTPSGPDVEREMRTFASVRRGSRRRSR
jgi:5,10-methylenetetrahydromethanopterin reductase